MADCSLCRIGAHRFSFPDHSDDGGNYSSAIGCANSILWEIDRWALHDDADARRVIRHNVDLAITCLAQYIDTLRKKYGDI